MNAAFFRCQIYRNFCNIKVCFRIADGAEDSAPVCILSEHCAFKQRGTDYAFCHDDGCIQIWCAGTSAFQKLACAFAIFCKHFCHLHHNLIQRSLENLIFCGLCINLFISCKSISKKAYHIVGRSIAIYAKAVVSYLYDL